ncbi:MAG: StbB family protein [Telluria sp.]
MKVAVINFSGNVGKTTIAAHLLKPRMGNARVFSVESLNVDAAHDGLKVEKMKGKQFGQLQEELMVLSNAIVDVGASNVEDFLKLMLQFEGSHEEFDYFVVPTVSERKQQADTVNTIRALAKAGIPKSKIRLVFNKVQVDESVDEDFQALFGLAKLEKTFVINKAAAIQANEVFARIRSVGRTLGEIRDDATDYRAKLRTSSDQGEREACVRMISLQRLAVTANRNLDAVFKSLFV